MVHIEFAPRLLLLVIVRVYSVYTLSMVQYTHTNPGRQVTMVTAFCTVTPIISESSL
jgi:hypothetical protein